jgi:FAD/FMN-containing dehydrogenase
MSTDLTNISIAELQAAVAPISIPTRSPLAFFANWARTFECRPQRVFQPTTDLQCRQIIELARREGARVHPVGVGHSPSDLACTNGWLVRMEALSGVVSVSTRDYGWGRSGWGSALVQGAADAHLPLVAWLAVPEAGY